MVLTNSIALLAVLGQQPMDGPAVLSKMVENLRKHKTVTGVLTWKVAGKEERVEFAYARPHFYREVRPRLQVYQSGGLRYLYMSDIKQFDRVELKEKDGRIKVQASLLTGLEALINEGPVPYEVAPEAKVVEFQGSRAYRITLLLPFESRKTLIVDATSFLPLAAEDSFGTETVRDVRIYSDLKFDVPLGPNDFAWSPPEDATPYVNPENYEAGFIKAGESVPDFELGKPGGGTFRLKELLKGKKGLVLNFWFYG